MQIRGAAQEVPVWQRVSITSVDRIAGPVIVEERETTIFVLSGCQVTRQESGSLVAEKVATERDAN
ncbi:hypothetical protein [Pseudooceanicola spongiae]|uniref:hypothetical protein n=1 Tax=Pseudooceanicola spongiae TaxID=2613965 RepID=UPI0021F80BA2|nr:hypothetical protein [Pseudooceanicola spongiae]